MKLTVLGDIMCELSVLKAAKKGKTYDFNWCFDGVRDLLKKSDYRICNLETPMAGEEAGYSKNFICFNAPDTYADAIKNAGFDLVATANNHTFDRGYDGLVRTIQVLDDKPYLDYFSKGGSIANFMSKTDVWGEDLTAYEGFLDEVTANVEKINAGECLL